MPPNDQISVYIAPEVADVIALHPYLGTKAFRAKSLRSQLDKQAQTLWEGHQNGDRRIKMHILSWWPKVQGAGLDQVMEMAFSITDARQTMAREYGFNDWRDIPDIVPPLPFEIALDALLTGDQDRLTSLAENNKELVTTRAVYGHGATLLHYLGANGVESHRQVTPSNAPALAAWLIAQGADPSMTAHMYGGGQTALQLARTSAHPHNAGIADALNAALDC